LRGLLVMPSARIFERTIRPDTLTPAVAFLPS
jgi:hypothetical protein